MFDLKDLYLQVAVVSHKVANLLICICSASLLVPELNIGRILDFAYNQIYFRGRLDSGNVSIIFISLVVASYLYEHVTGWADRRFLLKMSWDPQDFEILITNRFQNLVTLIYKNQVEDYSLRDEINTSQVVVFSVEGSDSLTRMLNTLQNNFRYATEYSGTSKVVAYFALFRMIWYLFQTNWIMAYLSFLIVLLAVGGWAFSNYFKGAMFWKMLNLYWGTSKQTEPQAAQPLKQIYSRLFKKYHVEIFDTYDTQMKKDLKHSVTISLK